VIKRLFDILAAFFGLLIVSPVIVVFCLGIWLRDFHNPFYVAERIGRRGRPFRMVKLRSMIADADKSGVTSTSNTDNRITWIGRLVRAAKLDEITQLWNVLWSDMSLVGPRPNVTKWGIELYTDEEMRLLGMRPGITDISSIVFADEGAILAGAKEPDLLYNQLIRPWKSRLSLTYLEHQSWWLDVELIVITIVGLFSRDLALKLIEKVLRGLQADDDLIQVASRRDRLNPAPPPGSDRIVTSLNHV